jgi:hypothetical protein
MASHQSPDKLIELRAPPFRQRVENGIHSLLIPTCGAEATTLGGCLRRT